MQLDLLDWAATQVAQPAPPRGEVVPMPGRVVILEDHRTADEFALIGTLQTAGLSEDHAWSIVWSTIQLQAAERFRKRDEAKARRRARRQAKSKAPRVAA